MRLFSVDWDRLNLLLLPTFLRKRLLNAFLQAVTAPIWTIYTWFFAQRTETLFLLRYDTSKRNVELVLRKKFNEEGIYIINNNNVDDAIYLTENDNEMVYLPVYLSEQGYISTIETIYLDDDTFLDFYIDAELKTPDFIIMVPSPIYVAYADEIRKYAALFTLPGFSFDVKPITD
jgi:hypothetical protein